MPRYDALPPQLPPLGLSREAAAQYVGISATKFDELVNDGLMPAPKKIGSRKIWDRRAVVLAFSALRGDEDAGEDDDYNEWDEAVA